MNAVRTKATFLALMTFRCTYVCVVIIAIISIIVISSSSNPASVAVATHDDVACLSNRAALS